MREREWADKAACKGKPIQWWYQPDDANKLDWERGDRNQGRIVCAKCPVRVDCLNEALRSAEPYGVWGGFDAAERTAIANGSEAQLTLGRCGVPECGKEFAAPYWPGRVNNPKEYCSSACSELGKKRKLRAKAAYDKAWRERQKERAAENRAPTLFDTARPRLEARVAASRERKAGA